MRVGTDMSFGFSLYEVWGTVPRTLPFDSSKRRSICYEQP